uniref:Chitin-binding type-2 domain-containing protein n=1 Tax=Anopheles atroparvus TaxID=41427 RepID=A0AAG5D196_ANOAO
MVSRTVLFIILVIVKFGASDFVEELEESVQNIDGTQSGVLLNITTPQLRKKRIMGICDGTKQIVCDSCNILRVCLGAETTVLCPSDQPYCIYGTTSDRCSPIPLTGVCDTDLQNAAVTCSAVGKFPDANNCRFYHECNNVGDISSVYVCPIGYVFNEVVQLCAVENVFSRCVTLQCDANYVGHVRYGLSKRFYGFCDGSGQTPIVFKCPIGASFSFITGSTFGECVYRCPGQGNFPNSNDPATYFQCFWLNRRMVFNLVHCAIGTTYKATLRYCI